MDARIFDAGIELGDNPDAIVTDYGRSTVDGREYALLLLGRSVAIHVADTSPAVLRALAAAATELAAWQEQQTIPQIGAAA